MNLDFRITRILGDCGVHALSVQMNEYLREIEFADGSRTVKVCQSPDSELGHASTVWDAAIVLCAFLESPVGRDMIRGAHVVELGSGTGIVAIAADHLGAAISIATDLPVCIPFIRQNIGLNPASACKASPIDWSVDLDRTSLPDRVDWILCADCVYQPESVDVLVKTILQINPGHGIIVSNEKRESPGNAQAEKKFIRAMYENGFTGKAVHPEIIREEWRCDDISLVIFERPVPDSAKGG